MSESTKQQPETNEPNTEKKSGFIGRMIRKLDKSMKQKAEEKSQQGRCCGGSDSKGGKCC